MKKVITQKILDKCFKEYDDEELKEKRPKKPVSQDSIETVHDLSMDDLRKGE